MGASVSESLFIPPSNRQQKRSLDMFNAAARSRATASSSSLPTNRGLLAATRTGTAGWNTRMAPQQQKRKQSGLPAGYSEDSSKGPMLRYEASLPRLPVPTLEETAQRYLKSLHPLLSETEFNASKTAVEKFVAPGSLAHELQKRLQARREDPKISNWLAEWWNNAAYLGYRDPVVPYVSYFYSHRDDRKRKDPAKRAAAISTAVLEFKQQVDQGTLEPEYMRKLPMAMSSYEWMFNACRVPSPRADYPAKYPAEQHQHIIAIRKNAFYKIPTHVNGRQLSNAELEQQFRRVYANGDKAPGVGIMTAGNRDDWTEWHERLVSSSQANKRVLQEIESSAFVVCLDDAAPVTLTAGLGLSALRSCRVSSSMDMVGARSSMTDGELPTWSTRTAFSSISSPSTWAASVWPSISTRLRVILGT